MATTIDTSIATTIMQQLGGRRFSVMTGAKNYIAHADGVSFRLPSRFANHGINYVKVQLTAMDDYTVTFGKVWGTKFKVIETREGVYVDVLREVFTGVTGLDAHL